MKFFIKGCSISLIFKCFWPFCCCLLILKLSSSYHPCITLSVSLSFLENFFLDNPVLKFNTIQSFSSFLGPWRSCDVLLVDTRLESLLCHFPVPIPFFPIITCPFTIPIYRCFRNSSGSDKSSS